MSAKDNSVTDVESNVTFLDQDGHPLAVRSIRFVPERSFGDLSLYSSAMAELLMARATALQTEDGVQFRLNNLRLSTSRRRDANPEFSHLEFDFEPLT